MPPLRITGLFTLRRLTAARGSVRLGHFVPTPHSTHILSALQMLRICLFGRPKRRKQPGRYATYPQNFRLYKKVYTKNTIDKIK
jgi:hypothetical protein